MKVQLSVSCSDLGQSVRGLNGAVVALFEKNPLTGLFDYLGQTEWIRDNNQPKFNNKLVFQYYGKGQSYGASRDAGSDPDSEIDGGASSAGSANGSTSSKRASSDNELKFAVYVISANQVKLTDALATAKASMETLVQFLDDEYAVPLKETEQHKESSTNRLPVTAKINFHITRVDEEDDKEIADLAKQTTQMMQAGRTFVQYTAWALDQPNVVNLFYKPPKTAKEREKEKEKEKDTKGPAPPSTATASSTASTATNSPNGSAAASAAGSPVSGSPPLSPSSSPAPGAASGTNSAGTGKLDGTLYWCEVGKRDEQRDRSIPLSAVTDVMIGKKTDVFRKPKNRHARLDQCFSILWKVVPKAERERWAAEQNNLYAAQLARYQELMAVGGPGSANLTPPVQNTAAPDINELPGEMHELNIEAESNEIRDAWVFGLMNILPSSGVRFHHAQTKKDREEEEARKKEEEEAQREKEFRERALKSQAEQWESKKSAKLNAKSGAAAAAAAASPAGTATATASVDELLAALSDGAPGGAGDDKKHRDTSGSVYGRNTLTGRRTQKKVDFQLERLSIILPNAVLPYNLPTQKGGSSQSAPRRSSMTIAPATSTPTTPAHTPASSRSASPARGRSATGAGSDSDGGVGGGDASEVEPASEKEPESEKEPASESEAEARMRAKKSMDGGAGAGSRSSTSSNRSSRGGGGGGGGGGGSDSDDSEGEGEDDEPEHGKLDAKQQKIQVSEALRNTLLEGRAFLMYSPFDDKPQVVSLWMQKVDLPAKTKPRNFMFWEAGTTVLERVPMLRTVSDRRALPITHITNIVLGKKTDGLRHRKNVVDDQCFALVSAAGEWEFEAETPELRDMFVMALRYAATASSKAPRIISDAVRPSVVALTDATKAMARHAALTNKQKRGIKLSDRELADLVATKNIIVPTKWKIHMNHIELKNLSQLELKERALCKFDSNPSFIVALHQQIGDPDAATYELVATSEWLRNEPLPVFAKKLALTYTEPLPHEDRAKCQHNLRFSLYNFPDGVLRPCFSDFEPPFRTPYMVAVTDPIEVGRTLLQAKRMTHFFGLVCNEEDVQNVFDDRAVRLEVYVDNISLVAPPGVSVSEEKQAAAAAAAGIADTASAAAAAGGADSKTGPAAGTPGAGEKSDEETGPGAAASGGGRNKSIRKMPIGRSAATPDADMGRVVERAKKVLGKGAVFRLHFSSRQPFQRTVFYEERKTLDVPTKMEGVLYWCEPGKRVTSIPSSIPLTSVIGVYLGKHQRVFPKADGDENAAAAKDDNCFSIIAQDKQLHIEADSPDVRDAWAFGFICLLKPLKKKLLGFGAIASDPRDFMPASVRAAPQQPKVLPPPGPVAAQQPVAVAAKEEEPKEAEPVKPVSNGQSSGAAMVDGDEFEKLKAAHAEERQKYSAIFEEHSKCGKHLRQAAVEMKREKDKAINAEMDSAEWKEQRDAAQKQIVDSEAKLKEITELYTALREREKHHTDQLAQADAMLQASRISETRLAEQLESIKQQFSDSEAGRQRAELEYTRLQKQVMDLGVLIAATPSQPASSGWQPPQHQMAPAPAPVPYDGPTSFTAIEEDKTVTVLSRPPHTAQVMDGWALPGVAVDFTAASGSIVTAADDLSFGEVFSGLALPDSQFPGEQSRPSVMAFKAAASAPAPVAALAQAVSAPRPKATRAGASEKAASDESGRPGESADARKRRYEDEQRKAATIARLSADNDRMGHDLVALKTEVNSYRQLEASVSTAASALLKQAAAMAAANRKEEEKKCTDSLQRLNLLPASTTDSSSDDPERKKKEAKKRSDEEDIRPDQPLALRVNKCVRLAARLTDELAESRQRFALAFANIESGVRSDIEKSVRTNLGSRMDEMETNAKQYNATHSELEQLRAERKVLDDELRDVKVELTELKAKEEKMRADEESKLEIMVTQLSEAREEAEKAKNALEKYQADPTILERINARPSVMMGQSSGAPSDDKPADGAASDSAGGATGDAAGDGDSKDTKRDPSEAKRKSFTLPVSSPLTGNESSSALKQKVIDLHNQLADKDVLIENMATMSAEGQKRTLKIQSDMDELQSKYERVCTELSMNEQKLEVAVAGADLSPAQKEALGGAQTKLIDELKSAMSKLDAKIEEKDKAIEEANQTKSFMEIQLKDGVEQLNDMKERLEQAGLKPSERKATATEDELKQLKAKAASLDAILESSVSAYEAKRPAVKYASAGPAAAADAASADSAAAAAASTATAAAAGPTPEGRVAAIIADANTRLDESQATIDSLNNKLKEYSAMMSAPAATTGSSDDAARVAALSKQIEEDKEVLKMRDETLESKDQLISSLKNDLSTKESIIKTYEQTATDAQADAAAKQKRIDELTAAASAGGGAVFSGDVAVFEQKLNAAQELVMSKTTLLEDKERALAAAEQKVAVLSAEHATLVKQHESLASNAERESTMKELAQVREQLAKANAETAAAITAAAAGGDAVTTQLRDALTAATRERDAARDQVTSANADSLLLRSARDDAVNQLTTLRATVNAAGSADRDFKSIMDEKLKLQTELDALKLSSARDLEDKKSLTVQLALANSELAKKGGSGGDESAALTEKQTQISNLTVQLAAVNVELSKRTAEVDALKAGPGGEVAPALAGTTAVVGEYKRQIDELSKELAAHKLSRTESTAAAEAARAALDQHKFQSTVSVTELESKHAAALAEVVAARNALQSQVDALTKERANATKGEARELDSGLKQLLAEKTELDTKAHELDAALKKVTTERDAFLAQNKTLRADADAQTQLLATRTKELTDLAAEHAMHKKFSGTDSIDFDRLSADKQRLTDELAAREKELLELRDGKRAAEVAKAEAAATVSKKDAELTRLRQELTDETGAHKLIGDKYEKAHAKVEELEKKLKALETAAAAPAPGFGAGLRSARGSIMLASPPHTSAEQAKWAAERADLVSKIAQLQKTGGGAGAAQIEQLQADLARERKMTERAKSQLAKLSASVISDMGKKMAQMMKTGTMAEMQEQLAAVKKQVDAAKAEQEQSQKDDEHDAATAATAAAGTAAADTATAAAATTAAAEINAAAATPAPSS